MAKVRDYAKLAADIKNAVGETNIVSAAHCATRLRLVLKESPSEEVTKQISSMPGVIQVMEKGGQYQVVIGTHAKDVYEELAKIMSFDSNAEVPEVKQGIVNRVIATMSAVFAPFVYVLAAGGLIQGCLIIISQFWPAFKETGTYAVMSFISWTPFTFLPILIAVTASKHFKCNVYIAVACCCAMIHPDWATMAARIADGEVIRLFGIPMAQTTYASTVLPPLFLVLVLSYLERFLEKHLPDIIKAIATPFICMAVMVPATFLVIGPISDAVANGIAMGYNYLVNTVPALAALIVGGFWQVIVIFGVHWGVTPMVIANFKNFGCDSFQVFQTCAVVAQAACCFGVFLKTKNKEMKNIAVSAGVTGIFGITEPAIYGVNLRLKKPFVCGCISGALGAVVVSFFGSKNYVNAALPGLLTVVNSIAPDGVDNPHSFMGMMIGVLISIVVSIVLIQIVGCDEKPAVATAEGNTVSSQPSVVVSEAETAEETKAADEFVVYAPLNGEAKALSEVNDATFSEGILGQGAAIIPSEGKLYAPFDGEVASVFDSKHAIALVNDEGAEMLIHIGLDTVNLGGKHFDVKVKDGDKIKKGTLLVEFDLEEIKKKYDTITPVLVTNADDFSSVDALTSSGVVRKGDPFLKVKA